MSDIKRYGLIPNQVDNPVIIDVTDTEAFLVRKANDGGDVFVIDSENERVRVDNRLDVGNGATAIRFLASAELIGIDINDGAFNSIAIRAGGVGTGILVNIGDVVTLYGNTGINGASTFGTNADGVIGLLNATAPTTSPANTVQLWAADAVAGQSSLYARTEAGGICAWNNAAGVAQRWCAQENVADGGKVVTMPVTSNGGIGFAQLGDGEEYALFTFTSAGVVTLIANSANVGTTEDNDTTFNIYDNGTNIAFNNELGSTKNLFVMLWFN